MAVTEYDEEPKQALFNAGTYGSISKITWLPSKGADRAMLEVTFTDLPHDAAKRLKKLKQKAHMETWDISTKNLRIK